MSWVFGFLMMSVIARAEDPASCPYFVERQEGTQIQQIWSEGSQSCFFSITPLNAYVDLIYRDHLLTSQGLFMVFNSYGPGSESEKTASREFYLFPRLTNQFSHKWDLGRKELEVVHITGDKFIFDSRKARLKSLTRAHVTVANDVDPSNRGGVEISNYQGLLLDGGFRVGNAPTSDAYGQSIIKDKIGNQCVVTNKEVFYYNASDDIIFRFSDKEFLKFLRQRCPKLSP